jgi:hypothetical protein
VCRIAQPYTLKPPCLGPLATRESKVCSLAMTAECSLSFGGSEVGKLCGTATGSSDRIGFLRKNSRVSVVAVCRFRLSPLT